jgi:hypothetical protein
VRVGPGSALVPKAHEAVDVSFQVYLWYLERGWQCVEVALHRALYGWTGGLSALIVTIEHGTEGVDVWHGGRCQEWLRCVGCAVMPEVEVDAGDRVVAQDGKRNERKYQRGWEEYVADAKEKNPRLTPMVLVHKLPRKWV